MPVRDETFLAEASLLLSRSLDPEVALTGLAAIAVPSIADGCLIHVIEDGAPRLVAHVHADPGRLAIAQAMHRKYPPALSETTGIYRVLRGGPAELYEDISEEALRGAALDEEHSRYLLAVGYRSAMVVPMVGRDAVLGALTFTSTTSGRRYSPSSLVVAADLGRRAGLALENSRLYEAERVARRAAERAASRLERLYRLTIELSPVVDAREVAAIFVAAGGDALGADGGYAWLVDDAGAQLEMVAERGFAGIPVDRYKRFPIDAPIPLCDAIRARQPMWFTSPDDMHTRYPATLAVAASRYQSWAVVPFHAGERGVGGVSFSFAEPQQFGADTRAFLDAMARQASLALERCRLFAAERRATEQARLAERRKDEFLAMLGHELRNPLAPLITAIDLIRMAAPDSFVREREVIDRAVAHITRLIDDLLDVSRITRGKVPLNRAPLDVAAVIASAVAMTSPLLDQRRHHLRIDVPSGLHVDGDEVRLAQVFQNLLTNAARYTPPGGHIEVIAARDGAEIEVRVRDDGCGIHPELLVSIFELFMQGPRPIDRSEGGLGLGLTLVKRLVELHGGTVTAASAGLGHGAELTVRLPATARAPAPVAAPPAVSIATLALRVLVVDDNEDAAETLAELLRHLGYLVVTAPDAPSALELATHLRPQIAVLDIGLPVLDGYELARLLRERLDDDTLTLIAVTGYGQDEDRVRSASAGFDHHLVKPVDLRALEAAMTRRRGSR